MMRRKVREVAGIAGAGGDPAVGESVSFCIVVLSGFAMGEGIAGIVGAREAR
jgi:hypothetical protein